MAQTRSNNENAQEKALTVDGARIVEETKGYIQKMIKKQNRTKN